MAKDKMQVYGRFDVKICLIGNRNEKKNERTNERTRNLPSCNELDVLVVGDFDDALGSRDIVVETNSDFFRRINELNQSYLPLQYPLLLPYGEGGYKEDITLTELKKITPNGRKYISARQYFAFRLHDRENEASNILSSRGLTDVVLRGDKDLAARGKRIILPSSFTCGARYMIQNNQDAMAICRNVGYPDLFITFTCNLNCLEIVRFLKERNLRAEDGPYIVCRVLKAKLDEMIKDFREESIYGKVVASVHNHKLHLKVGTPIVLLRNLDYNMGLCNGTRSVVTRLAAHVLECKILTGAKAGKKVLLPRMSLTPSDVRIPFKFQRRQFPIMISYAMTVNKIQGQSLSNVELFLKKPVFSHGQLYVSISRVTNRKGLKILVCNEDEIKNHKQCRVQRSI